MTTEQLPDPEAEGLYGAHAGYYDAIYHWKAYRDEAARLHEFLAAEGVADGERVLDAACGTGGHLEHLDAWYDVAGFDRSEAMLDLARARVPAARLFAADMTDFEVDAPVGAVLCLFSSIGYVHPEPRLRAALACFAQALRPGGVLVIEPWLTPEAFSPGHASLHTFVSDDLKLARAAIGDRREGDLSVIRFHWLAARRGAPDVEHFEETHTLWLCPTRTLLEACGDAGFDCRFEKSGLMVDRGLIIGRRRDG